MFDYLIISLFNITAGLVLIQETNVAYFGVSYNLTVVEKFTFGYLQLQSEIHVCRTGGSPWFF